MAMATNRLMHANRKEVEIFLSVFSNTNKGNAIPNKMDRGILGENIFQIKPGLNMIEFSDCTWLNTAI